ncbi:MAG: RNA methyltransferase [Actinomycetota bacterium]
MTAPGVVRIGTRNPRLRRLRRLVGRSKARSEERAFVVDGPVLVAEALRSPVTVLEVFGAEEELADDALATALAGRPEIEVFEASASVLTEMLDPVTPRPLAAVVSAPDWAVDDLGPDRPVLVAVELRDPGNLGTMIRTAEAAGLAGVVVAGASVDPTAPKVVRASAGSVLRLPVVRFATAEEAIGSLGDGGRPVWAAVVQPDAEPYDRVDLRRAAIVVGNEPHGLAPDVVRLGDGRLTIPVAETVESLNVAAAASVLSFEAARQRRSDRPKLAGHRDPGPST